MYKNAAYLAHVTNKNNIHSILEEGKLKTLNQLAEEDKEISVENFKGLRLRTVLSPKEKKKTLQKRKTPNKIFFTNKGYEPSYGDYVILKKYNKFKDHDKFTFIPNEVVVNRPVSLKRTSMIFVPDNEVEELSKKYPNYLIRSNESLPLPKFRLKDKANKASTYFREKKAELSFLGDSFLMGSSAIGIDLPGKSDKDYMVKADSFEDAVDKSLKLIKRYPNFRSSNYNTVDRKKLVFTGTLNGVSTDIAFDWSGNYDYMKKAFDDAKDSLTDKEREEIRNKKVKLKNSFIFPETRYNKFKIKKNKELGVY